MNPYIDLKVYLGRWATRVEFRNPENKLTQHDISELLRAWSEGDQAALEQIIPLVYNELRRMAAGYLRRRRGAKQPATDGDRSRGLSAAIGTARRSVR